jgi:CBS domain-containing protein
LSGGAARLFYTPSGKAYAGTADIRQNVVVAAEFSPTTLTLSEIMGPELVTAREDEDVFDAIQRMRSAGVRRMPVVAADGSLCGIVPLDDILEALAEEMNQIASLIAREQWQERQTRR